MRRGETLEESLGLRRQCQLDPAAVSGGGGFGQQLGFFHAGDQFGGGVGGDQELLGDRADGGRMRLLVAGDGEQSLMLLGRQAFGAGRGLAEGLGSGAVRSGNSQWPRIGPGRDGGCLLSDGM